ncbi:putative dihydrolipoyllysine-residue acetyltransferase component [Sesbania bispinosa]|nr:putative dihydrolipoyllysine-residue acetyltransferase component [Sesbania bispinosa]
MEDLNQNVTVESPSPHSKQTTKPKTPEQPNSGDNNSAPLHRKKLSELNSDSVVGVSGQGGEEQKGKPRKYDVGGGKQCQAKQGRPSWH